MSYDVLWWDVMSCDVIWCHVMSCDVMWWDVMWYDVIYLVWSSEQWHCMSSSSSPSTSLTNTPALGTTTNWISHHTEACKITSHWGMPDHPHTEACQITPHWGMPDQTTLRHVRSHHTEACKITSHCGMPDHPILRHARSHHTEAYQITPYWGMPVVRIKSFIASKVVLTMYSSSSKLVNKCSINNSFTLGKGI